VVKGRTKCDFCNEENLRIRDVGKVCGKRMCKKCQRENRKANREINGAKRNYGKYAYRQFSREGLPFKEGQVLFNLLIKQGIGENKAKQRVNSLSNYERKLFSEIHEEAKNKTELNKLFKEKFKQLK